MQIRTVKQLPNEDGFAKAGELIEIRGRDQLTLDTLRLFDLLMAHAATAGWDHVQYICKVWQLRHPSHKGTERVRTSLERLRTVQLSVPYRDDRGRMRVVETSLLAGNDRPLDESNNDADVYFSFSPQLKTIIHNSAYWGRIKTELLFAFSSKYSFALYQAAALRVNRDRTRELIAPDTLRVMLGVADGLYPGYPQLKARVTDPSEAEVNALSDMVVSLTPIRAGGKLRGRIVHYSFEVRRKTAEEQAISDALLQDFKRPDRRRIIKEVARRLSLEKPDPIQPELAFGERAVQR